MKEKIDNTIKLIEMEKYLGQVDDVMDNMIVRMQEMEDEHDQLSMLVAQLKNDMDRVKPRLGLPVG